MRLVWSLMLGWSMSALAQPTPEQADFFEKKIRPVLVKECHACHSGAVAKPMGGVRVDTREGLAAALTGNRLIEAIRYSGAKKMPPSGKLPAEQIAAFEAWVKDGSPDPRSATPAAVGAKKLDWAEARRFWAFRPVAKPAVPTVSNPAWVRSPIDAFLLAKLDEAKLKPAAPASKRDLIRRVTYNLTGLPPTPAEIADFLADSAPDAFAKVVDRLLASPHYGERWARHWLDLVRYAETNGHEYDNDKQAPWRYRDYVIRAFNEDVRYDQFVREHLAGDLLTKPRLSKDGTIVESPLATGFLWFGEVLNSATDSVKSRADEVDNQIDVMGKAFQGLTVACARCHDHKFDPIPTADYYSLAGVMHSTALREEIIDAPSRRAKIAELSRELQRIRAQRIDIEGAAASQPSRTTYREGDKVLTGFNSGFDRWRVTGAAFGDAPEAGTASSLRGGSNRFVGTLTSPLFRTGKERYLHVRIGGSKGNERLKENGTLRLSSVCDGYKGQHIVPEGKPGLAWKTIGLVLERERSCYLEIVDYDRNGHIVVDEIVYSDHKEPPTTVDAPRADKEPGPGTMAELDRLSAEQAALEAEIPESAYATVAGDLDPRDVKIHVRGNHQQLGEVAPRGFLKIVSELSAPVQGSGRLEVAERIASAQNPLTARVMVNRIWRHHFGQGIVRSPDNFGVMGEAPTHQELLDYLAARFVESGWSVKAMHRLLLNSSAYQMASTADAEAARRDPQNKLLSHMPVRRLEAESIRDSILAVSGRLDRTMFGPSVKPHISKYQDGRGKPQSGPVDGDGRRSIYVQVRRNFLTPMLLAFDYPLPISSMGARGSSTVPSQALMMMNSEFVAGQARLWAQRAMRAAAGRDERIAWLYETGFGRAPDRDESARITEFLGTRDSDEAAWADVAHVLMNSAEFYYVR